MSRLDNLKNLIVSTHSRPKAAGKDKKSDSPSRGSFQHTAARRRLGLCNTGVRYPKSFNTQPPEGGWVYFFGAFVFFEFVSTHSRPKAAGQSNQQIWSKLFGFNTQPPEGGWLWKKSNHCNNQSFQHTAARRRLVRFNSKNIVSMMFQHTAARRRLAGGFVLRGQSRQFQHTAARRRLASAIAGKDMMATVSTHSRPKAAGLDRLSIDVWL